MKKSSAAKSKASLPFLADASAMLTRSTMSDGSNYFLKYNPSTSNDMFIKEANGLKELAKANAIRIPKVLSFDEDYILLEYIPTGNKKKNFFEEFGRSFAEMHKFTSDSFGFYEDNYIGSNPQKNIPDENEKDELGKFLFQQENFISASACREAW